MGKSVPPSGESILSFRSNHPMNPANLLKKFGIDGLTPA